MKVSIVTVSFNQQQFLAQALDSVLTQDYPDLEYIVVDPGSTDGSRDVINRYGSRITHRVYEKDSGAADGLNRGFSRATGEIYAFLNSDDFLLPGAVHAAVDFFTRHPEIDLLMGDGCMVNETGAVIRHIRATSFTPSRYYYGGTLWMQQSTFFRASSFQRVGGFNCENRTCWDGELFLSIVRTGGQVGYLHKDLGAFRIHSGSITGTGRLNDLYRIDQRRIFADGMGRQWNHADNLLRYGFKAARFLEHPAYVWDTLRPRRNKVAS